MGRQKKWLLKRIWCWLNTTFLLTILICVSILIYLLWKLEAKQQIAQQQYELQNNYLISTANLADNPAIHSFFTDLLTTYAEKFAGSKSINTSQLPLKFAGFYDEQEAGRNLGTMDRAETILYPASQKVANIYWIN